MRRIAETASGERGAVAVLIAVFMVVLLGFAAISVDVAKLYSERAQLQNGADAAALMVAHKCAKSDAANCSETSPLATDLTNKNAVDGLSNLKSIVLNVTDRTVQVTTGAQESGVTPNSVSSIFAGVLGFPTSEVNASSSATWGTPWAGRTAFPLTFSVCQVRGYVGSPGPLQLLQEHGKKKNTECKHTSSGATIPGGFGWLNSDAGACGVSVDIAENEGGTDPGNNQPGHCSGELDRWINEINAGRQVVVYLPVFDGVTGQGNNALYRLVSFAAFSVTGWKFSGDPEVPPYTFRNKVSSATGVTDVTQCIEACRGIIGRFIEFVSLGEGFTLGPVKDPHGAFIVRLTH